MPIRSFGRPRRAARKACRKGRWNRASDAARLLHTTSAFIVTFESYLRRNTGMRTFARIIYTAALLVLLPVVASAQTSAIAGTVKDTSGAVLPGVTVEAS